MAAANDQHMAQPGDRTTQLVEVELEMAQEAVGIAQPQVLVGGISRSGTASRRMPPGFSTRRHSARNARASARSRCSSMCDQ